LVSEIIVIARFGDADGEKAIEVAKRACSRALREYGMKVVVVPLISWSSSSLHTRSPIVLVNGRVIACGRVPSEDEVLEALLNPPRARKSIHAFIEVPAAVLDDDTLLAAAENF